MGTGIGCRGANGTPGDTTLHCKCLDKFMFCNLIRITGVHASYSDVREASSQEKELLRRVVCALSFRHGEVGTTMYRSDDHERWTLC